MGLPNELLEPPQQELLGVLRFKMEKRVFAYRSTEHECLDRNMAQIPCSCTKKNQTAQGLKRFKKGQMTEVTIQTKT